MAKEKDVLTTGEVAKVCNVAPRTVSKWFDSGQLNGYRIPGSKDRRIPMNSLIKFMKAHGIPLDGLVSSKTRVLIADGELEVAQTLQRLLTEHAQYDVHIASTSCEAGFECERFRPNIILADIDHDGIDGRGLAKLVRGHDDLQITKIVAISSKLTDGQSHQLRTAGFDSVLKKPFNLRQVIAVIEEVLALVY